MKCPNDNLHHRRKNEKRTRVSTHNTSTIAKNGYSSHHRCLKSFPLTVSCVLLPAPGALALPFARSAAVMPMAVCRATCRIPLGVASRTGESGVQPAPSSTPSYQPAAVTASNPNLSARFRSLYVRYAQMIGWDRRNFLNQKRLTRVCI